MGMVLIARSEPAPPPPRGEAGFSLAEVMVASLILMLIVLGIVPLFARAGMSNASGADSTQISHFTRTRAEELVGAFFNSTPLAIPAGETLAETVEHWQASSESFSTDPPLTGEKPRWNRVTRIRQYNIGDLDSGDTLSTDEALDGGVAPSFVHIKEIEVAVESNRELLLGGRRILIKTLKSF